MTIDLGPYPPGEIVACTTLDDLGTRWSDMRRRQVWELRMSWNGETPLADLLVASRDRVWGSECLGSK